MNEQDVLSDNDEYTLSLAIIYINDEALDLLNQSQFQDEGLMHQNEWYEALLYLRLGNMEEARARFLNLSMTESVYTQYSENLLRQI